MSGRRTIKFSKLGEVVDPDPGTSALSAQLLRRFKKGAASDITSVFLAETQRGRVAGGRLPEPEDEETQDGNDPLVDIPGAKEQWE